MQTLIKRSFTVPVSVDVAWNHFARVEQWTTWAKHIKQLELTGDKELGADSQGIIHLQNGVKSTFAMTEFNLHRNWKWVGPFLWLTIHYDHQFRSLGDDSTEMTFIVKADGFAVSVLGRIFAIVYNGNLDVAIPKLIQEYEQIASN